MELNPDKRASTVSWLSFRLSSCGRFVARLRYLPTLLLVITNSQLLACQERGSASTSTRQPLPEYIQGFFLSDAVKCEEKGELQLTIEMDSRSEVGTTVVAQTEYGLTNRLQFGFELPYGAIAQEHVKGSRGWSTSTVGVMYQIIKSSSPVALSAGVAVEVPNWGRGGFQYAPTIGAAKSFRQLQVHASFAASVQSGEKPSFEYNVASVFPIRRNWFPTFEFNHHRVSNKTGLYLTPGIYRHLSNRFELGFGIPVSFAGAARATGLITAFNWELGGVRDSD